MRASFAAVARGLAFAFVLVVLVVLVVPTPASAACAVAPGIRYGSEVAHLDARSRLAFIDREMARGVGYARLHTFGWGGLTAGSLAVNGVWIFFADDTSRPDRAVALATGTAGLASTIFSYPAVLSNQPKVAALAALDAGGTLCERLEEAERIFVETARHEEQQRGIVRHALNVVFNGSMALVLGLGYGRWTSAALQSGSAFVIGEAIILTRPTGTIAALERYRAANLGSARERVLPISVSLFATAGQVGIAGEF